ncbi:hypothetical protein ABTZ03_10585 [Kitasatospora sp. NPDC096077]|uniref:hypothetical protein n=1 Tax=Kitasatospora sp. NPDC096077 TaxID=3155544 RepID=UPI00331D57FC
MPGAPGEQVRRYVSGVLSERARGPAGSSAYVTVLFSVFAGTIDRPELERCLAESVDEAGSVACVRRMLPGPDEEVIRRITRISGRWRGGPGDARPLTRTRSRMAQDP